MARAAVGKTATIKKDLYLYHDGWGTVGVERADLEDSELKSCIAILHPGEKVEVTSIVSRRLPRGLTYYFVIRPLNPNQKFTFDREFEYVSSPGYISPDSCIDFGIRFDE